MMPETTGCLLVVAGALVGEDGRVLVQRRPAHKQHGGLWEFPGGKVEPGEEPAAALARELAEELGIAVEPTDCLPLAFSTEGRLVLLLYRCAAWTGTPLASDGATLDWVAADALAALPMPPADRPLIPALLAASRS